MTLIIHRGRRYTAEPITKPEDKAAGAEYTMRATQGGAEYLLVRNQKDPTMLFAIRINKLAVPSGWWFTDKDGTLRSITP